jgi:fibro-slime domain-containing protein
MAHMTTRLGILVSFLSAALLVGCGGGSDSAKCVSGLTIECPCPTGQHGAQTCNASGTFAACVCAIPTLDAGGLGGAGGIVVPTTSSGTGGQVAALPDARAGGTGGVIVPITSLADASTTVSDTGVQDILDSGVSVEVGALDAPQVVAVCGDGITSGAETCDDGNTVRGDGCSSTCQLEIGYKCNGSPSKCSPTVCGDGKKEGTEGCDDGNTMPFDGCSEDCQLEPNCSGTLGCTSQCGDGILMGSEQCDDGNQASGDGCSSACQIEPGWACTQPPIGDTMKVPVIHRDFKFSKDVTNGNDFERGVSGSYNSTTGMVNASLDAKGKPVLSSTAPSTAHVSSAASFATWYTDVSGINHPTASKMILWNDGKGNYVNRYGSNGEQWNVTAPANWCGTVTDALLDAIGNPIPCTFKYQVSDAGLGVSDAGLAQVQTDCQNLESQGYAQLPGSCKADSTGTYKAKYIVSKIDGTPLFFPVDGDSFTPTSELTAAQIAPYYDAGKTWPFDVDASGNKILHNFSFTSEVRYWFPFDKSKSYTLDFVGGDDVWVFINGKLAVDLGGVHTPVAGSIVIDANGNVSTTVTAFDAQGVATTPTMSTAALGLQDGKVYEIAVFYAQRQTTGAALKLTLPPFNTAPSECQPM